MANQDIIHNLWLNNKMPLKDLLFKDIGMFAEKHKHELNSKSFKGITTSGLVEWLNTSATLFQVLTSVVSTL